MVRSMVSLTLLSETTARNHERMVQWNQRALAVSSPSATYLRRVCPSSQLCPEAVDSLRPRVYQRVGNVAQEAWTVLESWQNERLKFKSFSTEVVIHKVDDLLDCDIGCVATASESAVEGANNIIWVA